MKHLQINLIVISFILIIEGCGSGLLTLPVPHAIGVNTGAYIPVNSDYNIGYSVEAYTDISLLLLAENNNAIDGFIPYFDIRIIYGQLGSNAKLESDLDMRSRYYGAMLMLSPPTPIVSSYFGLGLLKYKMDFEGLGVDSSVTFAELGLGHNFKYGNTSLFVRYVFDTNFDEPAPVSDVNDVTIGVNLSVGFPWNPDGEW